MKIELIKEFKLNDDPWYGIYLNGKYIVGTYNEQKAMRMYDVIKENPLENGNIILRSEIINVTSEETK
jgi:hypothetical protein